MYENKVWTLVDLPDDQQAIENKWIFKRKTDTDSSVTIYKARLVAKGVQQVQGVEYDKIFSLVLMIKSVRIMLSIATFYEIWQMDVKIAFLNPKVCYAVYQTYCIPCSEFGKGVQLGSRSRSLDNSQEYP